MVRTVKALENVQLGVAVIPEQWRIKWGLVTQELVLVKEIGCPFLTLVDLKSLLCHYGHGHLITPFIWESAFVNTWARRHNTFWKALHVENWPFLAGWHLMPYWSAGRDLSLLERKELLLSIFYPWVLITVKHNYREWNWIERMVKLSFEGQRFMTRRWWRQGRSIEHVSSEVTR